MALTPARKPNPEFDAAIAAFNETMHQHYEETGHPKPRGFVRVAQATGDTAADASTHAVGSNDRSAPVRHRTSAEIERSMVPVAPGQPDPNATPPPERPRYIKVPNSPNVHPNWHTVVDATNQAIDLPVQAVSSLSRHANAALGMADHVAGGIPSAAVGLVNAAIPGQPFGGIDHARAASRDAVTDFRAMYPSMAKPVLELSAAPMTGAGVASMPGAFASGRGQYAAGRVGMGAERAEKFLDDRTGRTASRTNERQTRGLAIERDERAAQEAADQKWDARNGLSKAEAERLRQSEETNSKVAEWGRAELQRRAILRGSENEGLQAQQWREAQQRSNASPYRHRPGMTPERGLEGYIENALINETNRQRFSANPREVVDELARSQGWTHDQISAALDAVAHRNGWNMDHLRDVNRWMDRAPNGRNVAPDAKYAPFWQGRPPERGPREALTEFERTGQLPRPAEQPDFWASQVEIRRPEPRPPANRMVPRDGSYGEPPTRPRGGR